MKGFLFIAALLTTSVASNARAQVDHLQCHKVKDSTKFSGAVVALSAAQVAFQLPGNCTVSGKAKEFCVPVDKTVVDAGDAPGGLVGPGQDLSGNYYICYKIKCPKSVIADTVATDQFAERALLKFKTAGKLCVPAVFGTDCDAPGVEDGANCDDGLYCTVGDACQGGNCTGGARDCTALDAMCKVGACDEGADACVAEDDDGATCEDGLFCTTGDTCGAGQCGAPTSCTAAADACNTGVCSEGAAACVRQPTSNGSSCTTNCMLNGTCNSGSCLGGTPLAGSTEGPSGDATCSDYIDNDCDGLFDGNDVDCQ